METKLDDVEERIVDVGQMMQHEWKKGWINPLLIPLSKGWELVLFQLHPEWLRSKFSRSKGMITGRHIMLQRKFIKYLMSWTWQMCGVCKMLFGPRISWKWREYEDLSYMLERKPGKFSDSAHRTRKQLFSNSREPCWGEGDRKKKAEFDGVQTQWISRCRYRNAIWHWSCTQSPIWYRHHHECFDHQSWEKITNQNQTNDLQNDIDRLDEWSDKWKLRFNVAKCKTMHIGYHNDKHIYQMGSGENRMDLNQVTSEKDLGITFQDDLQFTKHLSDKVKKANSILGLIHRSFQHIDNEMLIHLYKALVRPHVEYASSVWSPFKLRNIKLIEGVQRRATRLSRDLRNEPYNIRLTTLGLPTLQFRRERADMLQVFKILNGYEDIDSSRLFTLSSTGLRGHSLKLFKERSRLLLCKQTFGFTQSVVDSWNNLPENVVNAPSINVFKSIFNTHTRGAASKFCPTWYMPTIHIQRPQMRTRAN